MADLFFSLSAGLLLLNAHQPCVPETATLEAECRQLLAKVEAVEQTLVELERELPTLNNRVQELVNHETVLVQNADVLR